MCLYRFERNRVFVYKGNGVGNFKYVYYVRVLNFIEFLKVRCLFFIFVENIVGYIGIIMRII